MEILGYKCFNNDMTNRYGTKFEVGKTYIDKGNIGFGFGKHGFHMCKRLEDTLRYFNAFENEISICIVKGSGQIIESFDNYYGYYDMYSVEKLDIIKQLNHDDIIEYALKLNIERVKRFISTFKLKQEEIITFKEQFKQYSEVINFIEYYQEKNLNIFNEQNKKLILKK